MQFEDDLLWLHKVRDFEIKAALVYFPEDVSKSVLELGSGTGYMIEKIRKRYPKVQGLEVSGSAYEYIDPDITVYDGKCLPFKDGSFDIIFSSHVLEHVPHIGDYLEETARILKPGGVAIHIIPSSLWRFLTSVMHYPALIKMIFSVKLNNRMQQIKTETKQRGWMEMLKFSLVAPRHGEYGNVITENYYFSRQHWGKLFSKSSLSLVESHGIGLVYCVRDLFRLSWSILSIQRLARVIGSTSTLYVLKKPL